MQQVNSLQQIRDALMTEGLMEEDAPSNPMDLFESWIAYAEELKFHNANAMTVATVDSNLAPSARNVLLRGRLGESLVFYTNYESEKPDLDQNNKAAVLMGWLEIERQIRFTGEVEKTTREAVINISHHEHASQISVVVSKQSRPVASRNEIEAAWSALTLN